jgi:uncharacterized membrane protein YraQ (UPF0718 family)
MLIPTIIMGLLAIVLFAIVYYKGGGQHIIGLKSALNMTISILPLLIFAFIVAGMIQILIPAEMISKWVGQESGFRGIMIGTFVGAIAPGGPYVSLPVAAVFVQSGASLGTIVAFLTGWSLWAINRIPMEVAILGWKITLVRLVSTFFFPPIAGIIANSLFTGVK